MNRPLHAAALLSLLASAAVAESWDYGTRNTPHLTPASADQTRAPKIGDGVGLKAEVLAQGLDTPWAVAVLPDGG